MLLPKNIVIVEDEAITQRYLKDILEQHDVNITGCFDSAAQTMDAIKNIECDMILMDINIKGPVDGIQLSEKILNARTVPIVFITAHNDPDTFQEVLHLSPYGFITKPFSSREIEVTLQLAYKRYLSSKEVHKEVTEEPSDKNIVISERYTYSPVNTTLYCDEQPVKLNMKQNKLLEVLSQNLNHTVAYDTILFEIWGEDIVADSALRTLVYSLRKTLPDLPIVSYSKVGYALKTIQ